jgi:hypothetical protein
MRIMVTLTVQKEIVARNDDSYQKKLDAIIKKLEKSFDCVDVTSEDNADEDCGGY